MKNSSFEEFEKLVLGQTQNMILYVKHHLKHRLTMSYIEEKEAQMKESWDYLKKEVFATQLNYTPEEIRAYDEEMMQLNYTPEEIQAYDEEMMKKKNVEKNSASDHIIK